MLLHDVIVTSSYWRHSVFYLFTVPVNLVYVKLLGLATKIRFWSKTCMVEKGTGVHGKKLISFLTKVGAQVDCHAASCPTNICNVNELKRQLIDVWCGLCKFAVDFLTRQTDRWRERLKEDTTSTACELTMLILPISVTLHCDYEAFAICILMLTYLIITYSLWIAYINTCCKFRNTELSIKVTQGRPRNRSSRLELHDRSRTMPIDSTFHHSLDSTLVNGDRLDRLFSWQFSSTFCGMNCVRCVWTCEVISRSCSHV